MKNQFQNTIQRTVLDSGLTVVTEQVPSVETFSLGITAKAGTRHETGFPVGIAHFMEHAAFRNSVKKNSRQIASQFESVGAYTNAFTTHEFTCFYVRAMNKHFRKAFNLLSEIVMHPNFKENEINKERKIIIEEIKSYLDDPEESIIDHADRLLFGEHPLGNAITGYENSVKKIDFKTLRKFHDIHYSPANLIIAAAGNLQHQKLVRLAEKLNGTNISPISERNAGKPEIFNSKELMLEGSFQQSHLVFTKAIYLEDANALHKLLIFNMLFGDGMSSRLYQNLREKYGLAYSIYSSISLYSDCAAFYIYAGTDIETETKTEVLILKEISKIFDRGVNASELTRAKEQLKTNIFMGEESLSGRMQSLVKQELFNYERTGNSEKIDIIDSVTISDMNEFITEHFAPYTFNKVIIRGSQ